MAYRGGPQGMAGPGFENGGGSRRRSAEPRFAANPFQYNVRVAIALVPSVVLLFGVGGKPVMAVLTVGLMIAYILDSLQLKQGSFFGIWGSLFATILALVFSGSGFASISSGAFPLHILALFVSFLLVFLVGVWASLQFRWFQLENPSVALSLERLLFACIPFTASTVQTWGVVSTVGMADAPWYLMLIMFEMYWLFSIPHPSSFLMKTERTYGGQIAEEALISGPLEGVFHTLTLLFLPGIFYIGSHHAKLFSSVYPICDMLLLFFVPLLFLLFASTRGSLWWLAKDPKDLKQVRAVNGAISLVVVIICLEVRVVFHAFSQYIQISIPYNYILVTVTLFGGAAAIGAYTLGLINDTLSAIVLTGLLEIAALSGAFVIGLPYKFFPAPLVAAFYIGSFFQKKSLVSYFIFAICASVPVTWFVVHNFYELNVWLGGSPIKFICNLLIANIISAMVIPGLGLIPQKFHHFLDLGLIAQAVLICVMENSLYNYSSMYYYGYEDDLVYPAYLVVLTTVIGLAVVRRLSADKRVGSWAVWVLFCLYVGKLSALFLSSRNILWVTVILLLAVSPPMVFYKDKGKGTSRMKPWQGLVHAGVVVVAACLCRYTISEVLVWLTGQTPRDGLVWGSFVLLVGIACSPIVMQHFSHVQLAKSCLVLVITFGACLVYMQPPFPRTMQIGGYARAYNYRSELFDDTTLYGGNVYGSWPSWLLIITVVTTLAALTSVLPIQHFVELRLFYAVGTGISVGMVLCAQYFTQAPILHALLVGAVVCATVFLVFTHLPSASSPHSLPWVFSLLVALLPVMYLLEGQLRNKVDGEDEKFVISLAIEGGRTSLLGLYGAMFMLIALEIKFQLASIMRDKAFEKSGGKVVHGYTTMSVVGSSNRLVQQRRPSITNSFTVKKLAAEGAWMPAIGNVATVLCFGLALILNVHLTGGADRSIFFLAPILLLLNQDANLLTGFGDRQRYFPLTAVISAYLVFSGSYRLWGEVWHGYKNSDWGLQTGGPGLFYLLKNLVVLSLTIPNHVIFNRFMWNYVKQSDFVLLLFSPLNIPTAIITDIASIRALSLLGILYAIVQYSISRYIRIEGMKYI